MDEQERLAHWHEVYETKDPTTVSWYQDQASTSLSLIEAVTIDRDGPVADIGGGASTLVDGLLADGYTDVTVLDISAAALQVAQTRLGANRDQVSWVAHDLLTWSPTTQFTTWHDRAVLHFLTDEHDRRTYSRLIASAVAPGGHAIIGTFAPGGPTHCSGLPVQQYSADSVAALLGAAFELVDRADEEHLTPTGAAQPFSWAVLKRR